MLTGSYSKKRRTVYFGSGPRAVSRPYVNKRNRLILGSGKKKHSRRSKKTSGKQKGGWAALACAALPYAVEAVKSIFK